MQINVRRRCYGTPCINGVFHELQIDTRSDITIVSNKVWKTLGSPKLDIVPFKVSNVLGDAGQLSRAMRCEAIFKGKTAATTANLDDIIVVGESEGELQGLR
ncbi:unnamed protein product [Hymenolepis diminuta]|uniref:Peptidase A2 domain-containing protein n=1 Tax=Hymenolepis diminuta TaxID=6216 RepID=A0A564Y6T4_HYMDI|nr:unnamed protein product [Hymenolepis diminuta]